MLPAALQALQGAAIPAGTKEQPLPRVLALLPGTHVEAESSTDFRFVQQREICGGSMTRQSSVTSVPARTC